MYNIKDLLSILNGKVFTEASNEAYYFMTSDMENNSLDNRTFTAYLKAWFVKAFLDATDDGEKAMVFTAAYKGDIYIADIDQIFQKNEASNAQVGEPIHKEAYVRIAKYRKFMNDPMYEDLTKRNKEITKAIKEITGYITIKELKRGRYKLPSNYRLSKDEINKLESVKLTKHINKVVHLQYDDLGSFGKYKCRYDEIPEDDVLRIFAFHTDKENPEIKVVFEDGTIVIYRNGDIRTKSYSLQEAVVYTKLCLIRQFDYIGNTENGIVEYKYFDEEMLKNAVALVFPMVLCNLGSLDDVYTKRMIEKSKDETNGLKQLAKKYNL